MKPKPLSALNHFTVPVAIKSFIRRATSRPAAPTASLPVLGSVPDLGPGTKPQHQPPRSPAPAAPTPLLRHPAQAPVLAEACLRPGMERWRLGGSRRAIAAYVRLGSTT